MSSDALSRDRVSERIAKSIALECVRNTFIEDLHAGIFPDSATGDYSDVKVITPFGEIPWSRLSRISDEEMKKLMIEVVNKLYTVFALEGKVPLQQPPSTWDRPHLDEDFLRRASKQPSLDDPS
jgi:hypothetical protein